MMLGLLLLLAVTSTAFSSPSTQRHTSIGRDIPPFVSRQRSTPQYPDLHRHIAPHSNTLQDVKEEPVSTAHTVPPVKASQPPVDRNVDLDGDGALSLAEVQYAAFVHHGLPSAVVEGLFNEVDKNHDGYLTSLEFNDIKPLVLAKAESAALRYMQTVDTDHNGLLSLSEAQTYILREYGIGNRDVVRVWRLVLPDSNEEMDPVLFSKLRRRIRGMSIRLARQLMKVADRNEDGHIDLKEAQQVAFEQEGIGYGDVVEMVQSVDDNRDGELNAPEFADFLRLIRARAVETSKKALKLKLVDRDGSGTLTMDEAKKIAFDHYGFDENVLSPFFAQADENEDNELDAVEFAGFRTVIREKAVRNALEFMESVDTDGDGIVSTSEAVMIARKLDDMDSKETVGLFNIADQDRSGKLDKVELADFLRLIRLSAIKFASDHFREFDVNKDKMVTVDELEDVINEKYNIDPILTRQFFTKVDVDESRDLNPGEIVDFRHEIRRFVADRNAQKALEEMKNAEHSNEAAETNVKHQTKTTTVVNRKTKEQNTGQPSGPNSNIGQDQLNMPVRISMNPPSRRPFLIRSTTVPQHSVRTRNKAPHSSGTQRKQFVDGKNVRQNQVPVEHTEIDRSIMFKHAEADKTSATEYPSSTTTETIINDDQKQETEEVNESIRTTEAMPDLTDMPELTDMTDLAEIHELTDVPDLAESVDVTSPSANELSAEANSTPDITENEAESSAVTDILKEIEAQTSVETSKADDSSETPSTVARPAQSAQVVHKLERARKGKHPEEGAGESKDVTLNSVTSTQPTDGFEYEDDISTSPGLPNSDEAEGASVTKIPSTTKVLVKVNASSDKKQKDTRNYLEVTTRATNEMTEQSDANQDDYGEDYEEMNHSSTSKPRVPAKATRRHSTFSTPHPNFSKLL